MRASLPRPASRAAVPDTVAFVTVRRVASRIGYPLSRHHGVRARRSGRVNERFIEECESFIGAVRGDGRELIRWAPRWRALAIIFVIVGPAVIAAFVALGFITSNAGGAAIGGVVGGSLRESARSSRTRSRTTLIEANEVLDGVTDRKDASPRLRRLWRRFGKEDHEDDA
jgi:hypothetical protein